MPKIQYRTPLDIRLPIMEKGRNFVVKYKRNYITMMRAELQTFFLIFRNPPRLDFPGAFNRFPDTTFQKVNLTGLQARNHTISVHQAGGSMKFNFRTI